MNFLTLGALAKKHLKNLAGSPGFWHGQRGNSTIYIIADDVHDRIRLMSPIGDLKKPSNHFLSTLLQANFDRALDAKYAMRNREVWAVCMHPLSSLTSADFVNFIDQIKQLVVNTGTTFCSTNLVFGVDDEGEEVMNSHFEVKRRDPVGKQPAHQPTPPPSESSPSPASVTDEDREEIRRLIGG